MNSNKTWRLNRRALAAGPRRGAASPPARPPLPRRPTFHARSLLVLAVALALAPASRAVHLGPSGASATYEGTLTTRNPLLKDEIVQAWIALDRPTLAKLLEGASGNLHEVDSARSVSVDQVAAAFDFVTGGGAAALVVRLPSGSGRNTTVAEDSAIPGGLDVEIDRLGRLDSSVTFHAYRIFRVPVHVAPVPLRITLARPGANQTIVRRIFVTPQGQKTPQQAQAASATFRVLGSGTFCAISKAGEELAPTQETLDTLWRRINADMTPVPPVPSVDFAKEQVVAIFAGQKSSGGHGIAVESVRIDGDTARVVTRLSAPRPGGIVTMALTSPYVLIAIARGPHTLAVTRQGP